MERSFHRSCANAPYGWCRKDAVLKVRLPEVLVDKLRARAKEIGVPYSRYVRMVLESDLAQENCGK